MSQQQQTQQKQYKDPVIGFMTVREEVINDDSFIQLLCNDFLRFVDNGCRRVTVTEDSMNQHAKDTKRLRDNILEASVI